METILVIEPEHIAREAFATMLADEGYATLLARDSAEAEKHLARGAVPDLVIVDSASHGASHFSDVLHALEALRDVPIIVVSNEAYSSRFAYAVAFFRKPFKPDELLTKVREWVRDSYGGQVRPRTAPARGQTRD